MFGYRPVCLAFWRSGEFDDMVIAPVFGFDDFQDYYRKSQSGQFLKGVRVPLLAVQVREVSHLRSCLEYVGRDSSRSKPT